MNLELSKLQTKSNLLEPLDEEFTIGKLLKIYRKIAKTHYSNHKMINKIYNNNYGKSLYIDTTKVSDQSIKDFIYV